VTGVHDGGGEACGVGSSAADNLIAATGGLGGLTENG